MDKPVSLTSEILKDFYMLGFKENQVGLIIGNDLNYEHFHRNFDWCGNNSIFLNKEKISKHTF